MRTIDRTQMLLFEPEICHAITESNCECQQNASLAQVFSYYNTLNKDESHKLSNDDICTPMECVKRMIDYLPDELWQREDLRILDPCSGNGNFGAYCKFKTSLDNIWFNELNPVRYANCKRILNPAHIICGDYFRLPINYWQHYDMIMANPPYSGGGNKNRSLSNEFIEYSIELLKDKGYLCFITPNNWMTYNNDNTTLKKLLTKGSFLVIDNDAKRFFPQVGSSFTIIIWQKSVMNNHTKVVNNYLIKDTQENVIIPQNLHFLPLYISQAMLSIIEKSIQENENLFRYRCDLHNHTKKDLLSDEQVGEFIYETIHTPRKTRYATLKQDIYDKWTIIVPLSTYYIPYIKHHVNTTQSVGYFAFDTEEIAQQYLQVITADRFKVIIHLTRYGNFNNILVLKHLRFGNAPVLSFIEQQEITKLMQHIKY